MQCIEEEGILKPFTRDTFSSCIKATYCEVDGKPIPIFKNPKDGGFKKSQKGLCRVFKDENGNIAYADGYTSLDIAGQENMLETVFEDGKIVKEQSLSEIRDILNNGKF
jgi:nicotinamide phosphoribosyltransferase